MKWFALPAILVLAASIAGGAQAQRHARNSRGRAYAYRSSALIRLPIGKIAQVDDQSPKLWGMSGMPILMIKRSAGNETPLMRTEAFDARTVEILSRTQAPPLRARDVHVRSIGGHEYIGVRRYFLLEVLPEDAAAFRMSRGALAEKWASRIRRVLPVVAPMPSRFGV